MRDSSTRWMRVKGPLSAAIATLLDMGWKPIHPTKWLDRGRQVHDFVEYPGISHHKVRHLVGNDLTRQLWEEAASARK